MSTINERIKELMEYKGENPNSLGSKMGTSRQTVTNVITNVNKPSYDFTESLLNLYPDVSAAWLMTGTGQMVRDGAAVVPNYNGKNNTATNSVNIGAGQQAAENMEVLMLREQVKDLKTELARCRETNEKLLEKILSTK